MSRDQCAMISMTCWSLWNRRNKWVWDRINGSAFGVKAAALNLLTDWRKAHVNNIQSTTQNQDGVGRWCVPPAGWNKINIDAAMLPGESIGVGAVVRDSAGQFMRARCGQILGAWQIREAEALSLKTALCWAKDLNLDHCIFESDSKTLVDACQGEQGDSYFHTIVLDCLDLCKHFNFVQIVFAHRSANSVAHMLATHSMSGLREWVDAPPEFIDHVLISDLA